MAKQEKQPRIMLRGSPRGSFGNGHPREDQLFPRLFYPQMLLGL